MNVTLPEKFKLKKKQIIIYVSIIIFCIIAIIIASYVQFYARIDFSSLIGIGADSDKYQIKNDEQAQELENNFESLFNNSVSNVSDQNNQKRQDQSKPLVYDAQTAQENSGNYTINVHIPYININSNVIDGYNKEIEDTFTNKMNSIKEDGGNTIYDVEYTANVEYDILSVMIKSNLKEGTNAQRVIIQTYNYDLRNNKAISLEEVLKIEGIDLNTVQEKINTKIASEQKKVEDLAKLGYNIYSRDTSSSMYNIENTTEFYLTNNAIYIMYPYGNNSFTSEMDMIIL